MIPAIALRKPTSNEGYAVNRLIQNCPPLDPNSLYCNLLQCSHFAETCVAAIANEGEANETLVGFVSGYLPPSTPKTLFVWQVAIAEQARGQGLASRLLQALLQQVSDHDIHFIETTITADNQGSWALFTRLAKQLDAPLVRSPHFERDSHFNGEHATEFLARIGPF